MGNSSSKVENVIDTNLIQWNKEKNSDVSITKTVSYQQPQESAPAKENIPSECPMHQENTNNLVPPPECPMHQENSNNSVPPPECPMHEEKVMPAIPPECPMQKQNLEIPPECPMHQDASKSSTKENDINPLNMVRIILTALHCKTFFKAHYYIYNNFTRCLLPISVLPLISLFYYQLIVKNQVFLKQLKMVLMKLGHTPASKCFGMLCYGKGML